MKTLRRIQVRNICSQHRNIYLQWNDIEWLRKELIYLLGTYLEYTQKLRSEKCWINKKKAIRFLKARFSCDGLQACKTRSLVREWNRIFQNGVTKNAAHLKATSWRKVYDEFIMLRGQIPWIGHSVNSKQVDIQNKTIWCDYSFTKTKWAHFRK